MLACHRVWAPSGALQGGLHHLHMLRRWIMTCRCVQFGENANADGKSSQLLNGKTTDTALEAEQHSRQPFVASCPYAN